MFKFSLNNRKVVSPIYTIGLFTSNKHPKVVSDNYDIMVAPIYPFRENFTIQLGVKLRVVFFFGTKGIMLRDYIIPNPFNSVLFFKKSRHMI